MQLKTDYFVVQVLYGFCLLHRHKRAQKNQNLPGQNRSGIHCPPYSTVRGGQKQPVCMCVCVCVCVHACHT